MSENRMKKICIHWIFRGCSRRRLDAKKYSEYFLENGYQLVSNPKKADFIILVTCAFSDKMAETSLSEVEKFKKFNAELIVGGCLPEIEKERLAKIFDGNLVSTKEIEKIDEIFKDNENKFSDLDDANRLWTNLNKRSYFHIGKRKTKCILPLEEHYIRLKNYLIKKIFGENSTFYYLSSNIREKSFYLRISWGCLGNCSYCAIKKAVGPLKSKPFDQCIKEFRKGISNGAKNFIIAADDIGSYGLDTGRTFTELLDNLTSIEGDYSIEIEEINTRWVVKYIDELERIMKRGKIKRICSPIQSGSERILKLMNRYHNKEKIKNSFLRLKNSSKDLILGTYAIIGFPSETEKDFDETLEFIKDAGIEWGFLIPFSLKKETLAEKINPKISSNEIKKRVLLSKLFLQKNNYKIKKIKKANRLFFDKIKK